MGLLNHLVVTSHIKGEQHLEYIQHRCTLGTLRMGKCDTREPHSFWLHGTLAQLV